MGEFMSKMSDLDLQRREVVDLNFVTDGTLERIVSRKSDRYGELLHEAFAYNLKTAQNYGEKFLSFSTKLANHGYEIFEELEQAETFARGLLLAVLLQQKVHADLRREQENEIAS